MQILEVKPVFGPSKSISHPFGANTRLHSGRLLRCIDAVRMDVPALAGTASGSLFLEGFKIDRKSRESLAARVAWCWVGLWTFPQPHAEVLHQPETELGMPWVDSRLLKVTIVTLLLHLANVEY